MKSNFVLKMHILDASVLVPGNQVIWNNIKRELCGFFSARDHRCVSCSKA